MRERAAHIIDFESQGCAPKIARAVEAKIDEIAGGGDLRPAIAGFVYADEAELFQINLGQLPIRGRKRYLQEIAAAGGFVGRPFAGRKGARLDETDQLPGRIEPADFVEYILAEMAEFEIGAFFLESVEKFKQVRLHERQRWRRHRRLVQSQADPPIGDDG